MREWSSAGVSLGALMAVSVVLPGTALAKSSWSIGGGFEGDSTSGRSETVDALWTPVDSLALSLGTGILRSSAQEGSFRARTAAASVDWTPCDYFGFAAGYNLWDDRDAYDKETLRGAIYTGTAVGKIGFVAESVDSDTKAQDIIVRGRRTQLSFDGMGYGADGWLLFDHFSLYGSYMGYHYGNRVSQLLAFLTNPNLANRPRLFNLASSGLTTAAALLHRSVTAGTDVFFGDYRVGLGWSQFHEIVTDTRTNVVEGELEWPLSSTWSAQVTAGVSDSVGYGKTYFSGARFTFYGR
jgi:hypothetical protein